MKTPTCLTGATLLFWGWQTRLLWAAVPAAFLIETAQFIRTKWDFSRSDFNKAIDVSTVFMAGAVITALVMAPEKAFIIIVKWLPLIFLPIIAAQVYSSNGKIDIQAFFLLTRRKHKKSVEHRGRIDVSGIYCFSCVMASATANVSNYIFYGAVVIFFAWGFWPVRSKRYPIGIWVFGVLAVSILGFGAQKGIIGLSNMVNEAIMEYYMGILDTDPFKSLTAIGDIGRLKLSDKIVLRVQRTGNQSNAPFLLRQASYDKFGFANWYGKPQFKEIAPLADDTTWNINPYSDHHETLVFYLRLKNKKAVLSLPQGTFQINEMKTGSCRKSPLGAVMVADGPSLIKGVVKYNPGLSHDRPPGKNDLLIPDKEKQTIDAVYNSLSIRGLPDNKVLGALKAHFLTRFAYSLDLKGKGNYESPLQNFLLGSRQGHCELFATATVLLLRKAGLPARYCTGYLANEYATLNDMYIIRQRDAHAWVTVYTNGHWEHFDTTPPSFASLDKAQTPSSYIKDIISFIGFQSSRFRHETGATYLNKYGLWLIFPLIIFLFFRLKTSKKIQRITQGLQSRTGMRDAKKDSPFYLIEKCLSEKGFQRHESETYSAWFARIENQLRRFIRPGQLNQALRLHNKSLFSESGLEKHEQNTFDSQVKTILERLNQ